MTTVATAAARDAQASARRRIEPAHVRVLLGQDVRRLGPNSAKATAGVLGVVVLALATGVGGRGFVTGLVVALLVMQPMFLALQLVKDKLDGTLHFLCALPVTPETLAAVRVVPIVAFSALGGSVIAALSVWNGVPAAVGHGPALVAATTLLLGALVPAALASTMLALSARFRFETLVSLPMLLLFGLAALTKVAERVVPAGTGAQLSTLLAQPWVPALLIALLCAALVGVVALAFRVTARTLARFTPESRGG